FVEAKVGRLRITRDGKEQIIKENVIEQIMPGEKAANMNPGGGGFGNPFEREIDRVVQDARNGLVSEKGAKMDYGVVFSDFKNLQVDAAATQALRAKHA
ncbi:MAG: hydantoinase B/oxoprolinase family protein, partial [Alphaproteobacteria bacterium]|nr:hydantoinase B/oxoprolinase family protein [Alphaproteobacteria bacterium]